MSPRLIRQELIWGDENKDPTHRHHQKDSTTKGSHPSVDPSPLHIMSTPWHCPTEPRSLPGRLKMSKSGGNHTFLNLRRRGLDQDEEQQAQQQKTTIGPRGVILY
mmetsp:Transcript_7692/g.21909  ORF Transcript_7692/g.21909 Transcript_7692/m.21909 type:complete len:105 (-) Transcript_7692:1317-1631(-)